METWFFNLEENSRVTLRSRVEGDGAVGDAFSECVPGGSILNLSYQDLASRGSGKITIQNDIATIEPVMVPVDHNPFKGT